MSFKDSLAFLPKIGSINIFIKRAFNHFESTSKRVVNYSFKAFDQVQSISLILISHINKRFLKDDGYICNETSNTKKFGDHSAKGFNLTRVNSWGLVRKKLGAQVKRFPFDGLSNQRFRCQAMGRAARRDAVTRQPLWNDEKGDRFIWHLSE